MRRNLVDRAVSYFAPAAGARRAEARARAELIGRLAGGVVASARGISGGYADTKWRGASRSLRSMASWLVSPGSAYADLPRHERSDLIARSFDAHRNHMLARAAIGRMRTNVVGIGLVPYATVDAGVLGISPEEADELNTQLNRVFASWAENPRECDAEATLDFYGLQALAFVSAMLAGDTFATTPFSEAPMSAWGVKVQMIDGLRCSNPNNQPDRPTLIDGIEMTEAGYPLRYWFRRRHPSDTLDPASANIWDAVEVFGARTGRRRAMHVFNDKDRIGMVRGAPMLAPILEPLQQLETYGRAELMAAVVSALMTVFIKRDAESLDEDLNPIAAFEGQTEPGDPGGRPESRDSPQIEMGSGSVIELEPGSEPVPVNPLRPNSNYDPFFLSVVTQIGAALELPRDELLLHYQSSYSAARAAMLQAWRHYVMRRWWLVQQFCAPIRALVIDEAVARGRLQVTGYGDPLRRSAINACMWVGPARGAMDEYREAQAAEKRIAIGISNETIETAAMMGEDWTAVHDQRVRERRRIIKDRVGRTAAPAATPPPEPAADPENPEA